jgi:hypothetical protein
MGYGRRYRISGMRWVEEAHRILFCDHHDEREGEVREVRQDGGENMII